MTFEEFAATISRPRGPNSVSISGGALRNLHAHLVSTGVDVEAVLAGKPESHYAVIGPVRTARPGDTLFRLVAIKDGKAELETCAPVDLASLQALAKEMVNVAERYGAASTSTINEWSDILTAALDAIEAKP